MCVCGGGAEAIRAPTKNTVGFFPMELAPSLCVCAQKEARAAWGPSEREREREQYAIQVCFT